MSEPSIGTFCREPVRILHGREIPLTPTVQTSETGIISRPSLCPLTLTLGSSSSPQLPYVYTL